MMRNLLILLVFIFGSYRCKTVTPSPPPPSVSAVSESAPVSPATTMKSPTDEPADLEATNPPDIKLPDTLPTYRASFPVEFDLINTTLRVSFDYSKSYLNGIAEITAAPYGGPRRYFTLDAVGFDIHSVQWQNKKDIPYTYKDNKLTLDLGVEMPDGKALTVIINYTAKPDENPIRGSAAITSDKGLYFINPTGAEKGKPTQIWTQGETESNSRWFPTIDKPDQRCTQEMFITVQDKYKTLSNGKFLGSKKNSDGTRTDHYKMELPHAPYLFMMAIGDYAVVKDTWNNIPLEYYVEPEYKDDARMIFEHTPEMLTFFSNLLGVKYPWPKFAQVIVRDYVSGAMENTTAVVFGDFIQKDRQALMDNNNEEIVAHEMFHHWFGDYVTTESWSNITLNEGFANYSEYLWNEYKHGRDAADVYRLGQLSGYLASAKRGMHDLIDFTYDNREAMFDAHSYNKGGLVLHMLRRYLGDTIFFRSLHNYLTTNALSSVEGHNLRLAFEKTSGQDLNWFFNQWYYGSGQPELTVTDTTSANTLYLTVEQTQEGENQQRIFQLPIKVDIYYAGQANPQHESIWVDKRNQTFSIPVKAKPVNIIFDADNSLLAVINYKKSAAAYFNQAYHNSTVFDRMEVLKHLKSDKSPEFKAILTHYLKDNAEKIRLMALSQIDMKSPENEAQIIQMAQNDPSINVKKVAIKLLAEDPKPEYKKIFSANLNSNSSGGLFAESLNGLNKLDIPGALTVANANKNSRNSSIKSAILDVLIAADDPGAFAYLEKMAADADGFSSFSIFGKYSELLMKKSGKELKSGIDNLCSMAENNAGSQWRKYAIAKILHDVATAASLNGIEETDQHGIQSRVAKILNKLIDSGKGTWFENALDNLKIEE